jgi:glutamine amidotransferase
MIAIIDYGMGNLRSVQKALELVGGDARIVRDAGQIDEAEKVILPGVGAYRDAMAHLREEGFVEPIKRFIESGKPFLGICLGLQLLFEVSEEDGEYEGLGVLGGRVVRFAPRDRSMKVPHMGWNSLNITQPDAPLLAGVEPGSHVYFVHSYYAVPSDPAVIAATCDYAGEFCAVVRWQNIQAAQFHPEKSQQVGQRMLANFAAM